MYEPTFAHLVTMVLYEDRLQAARLARHTQRPRANRLPRLFAWRQLTGAGRRLVRRARLATASPHRG